MTTDTFHDRTGLTVDEAQTAAIAHGQTTTAQEYTRHLGATTPISSWTWACGADLAQWGTFRRGEYVTRDIAWTLRLSEQGTGYGPGSDPVLAQRFDF